jgi:hypothetical protein
MEKVNTLVKPYVFQSYSTYFSIVLAYLLYLEIKLSEPLL